MQLGGTGQGHEDEKDPSLTEGTGQPGQRWRGASKGQLLGRFFLFLLWQYPGPSRGAMSLFI